MNAVQLAVMWIRPEEAEDLSLPRYQSGDASGMDLAAAVRGPIVLEPGQIAVIPTGLAVAIPVGYELQVRPRSGLAIRHGITVVNSPGTIDADYRGEIKVGLINLGIEAYTLNRGDRIAQLVLAPVLKVQWRLEIALDSTARASGGFGHTGLR